MKKFFYSFLILLLSFFNTYSQNSDDAWRLGHWLSAEEMLHKNEIGKSFIETDPPVGPVRNFAEYDRMQGALVRYPFGIPVSLIKEMSEDVMVTTIVLNEAQQNTVINQYQSAGVNMANTNFLIAPSNSYWTRDYGPWFASDSSNNIGIVDFPYNRPRPDDDEIPKLVAGMMGIPWYGMDLIHTGGNYMTDGFGTSSSTTLVYEENPTMTPQEISQKVLDYLGIQNYLVEEDPNGTYIDHIDCWGKFLGPDKIIIRKVPTSDPQYDEVEATAAFYASTPCSYGYNYHVYRVFTPNGQPYTNSVILNNKVLVPIMNSSWDDTAIAAYQAAMPGYEIIGFIGNPSTPWEATDALHCRVMGLADLDQLFIKHIPLSGNQPAQDNFLLNADLLCYSDSAAYTDSILIWYRVNGGSWTLKHMNQVSGNHYSGYIPMQPAGSVIDYYLYAADRSGNHGTAPFIGAADPFTFTAVYTDITAVPDTLYFEDYNEALYGKTSMLHNFTADPILLNTVQESGVVMPVTAFWMTDMTPFTTLPMYIPAGDSAPVHVNFLMLVDSPTFGYNMDSLHYSTQYGDHKIMLMLNDTLVYWGGTKDLSKDAVLYGNYPNPFQSSTTINFDLKKQTTVRLSVLNTLGYEVAVLEDGIMKEGKHNVTFDANGLSAGVYFMKLTTPGGSVTKKMMLIK